MSIPIFERLLKGISIIGSIVPERGRTSPRYSPSAAGRTKVIAESRRLDQVNEAMAEVLHRAKVPARLVFGF
jgi:propanol-preferring alcohol dehydrogenase